MKAPLLCVLAGWVLSVAGSGPAHAESPYQSSADFAKYASRLRESTIMAMEPHVIVPTATRPVGVGSQYPWKKGIVTTIFWVGEAASVRNPVHNRSSSWDLNWAGSFGGYDNPDASGRRNYIPIGFTPRQNPFYFALPYNDVTHSTTKPESRIVIPWFKQAFVREGQSVCKDRWIEITNPALGRTCFAQWSDCGPFRTDHWQYVFGNELPKPNLNHGAGLDVSPAVRDYIGLGLSYSVTNWRFVEARDVPRGPWSLYGDNNTFVQNARAGSKMVSAATLPPVATRIQEGPKVITK